MTVQSTAKSRAPASSTVRQAGRFGLVGLANTVIDFGAFSLLRLAGIPLLAANLISTSLGMAFSFFANRKYVFAAGGPWRTQAVLFFLGTAFSMYVLQTVVILGVTRMLPAPLDAAESIGRVVGLRSSAWAVLIRSNTAKLCATVVSMTWNFCFYRFAVFHRASVRQGAPGTTDEPG
jgi:putative flippase GtrA